MMTRTKKTKRRRTGMKNRRSSENPTNNLPASTCGPKVWAISSLKV
jgi:hypothetical protein